MWVGVTDPRTNSADAGANNFDISLPNTSKIRKVRVFAANTTAVRGVISVLLEAKGSFHPLGSVLPTLANETVSATIESEFVAEGQLRGSFANCSAGDILHLFVAYELWRPND